MSERIKIEGKKGLEKQLENSNAKGMKWFSEAKRVSAGPGEDVTANSCR